MQYPWRHFGENNTLQRIYTAEIATPEPALSGSEGARTMTEKAVIARHSVPKQPQGQAHESAWYQNTRN